MNLKVPGAILPIGCSFLSQGENCLGGLLQLFGELSIFRSQNAKIFLDKEACNPRKSLKKRLKLSVLARQMQNFLRQGGVQPSNHVLTNLD